MQIVYGVLIRVLYFFSNILTNPWLTKDIKNCFSSHNQSQYMVCIEVMVKEETFRYCCSTILHLVAMMWLLSKHRLFEILVFLSCTEQDQSDTDNF